MSKKKLKKYDAESISHKKGLDHIKAYPAMYLGSTSEIGVHQTVKEVVTNSIDEIINGFGSYVKVTLKKDNFIRIEDNGRGIPIQYNKEAKMTALDMCVALINSGGKYDKDNYASSGGMYGVGSKATNSVSSVFIAEVKHEGEIHALEYRDAKRYYPKKLSELDIIGKCKKGETGTAIEYKINPDVMSVVEFDYETTKSYLKQLSYLNAGATLILEDARGKKVTTETFKTEEGLKDFVNDLTIKKDKLVETPIVIPKLSLDGNDSAEIAFTYTREFTTNIQLFVNRNLTPNGGTAITGFKMGLTKALNEIAKVLSIMREKEAPLKSSDVSEGLTAIVSCIVAKPELEGQTKNKLNNTEIQSGVLKAVYEHMKIFFEENPKITLEIASKALQGRRAREASAKARKLMMQTKTPRSLMPSKLRDCKSKKRMDCELMLVEGDSASTGITYGRDVHTQAFYPLRGKCLNVETQASLLDVMGNDVFKALDTVLGCGFGDKFSLRKLRYGKIIILADADVDGKHIESLLLTWLYRCYKPLITEGHVYICIPPLYRVRWGKDNEVFLNSNEEMDAWRASHPNTKYVASYMKGLGEMPPKLLGRTCVEKDGSRRLVQVTIDDIITSEDTLVKLMGKESEYRKRYLMTDGLEL